MPAARGGGGAAAGAAVFAAVFAAAAAAARFGVGAAEDSREGERERA